MSHRSDENDVVGVRASNAAALPQPGTSAAVNDADSTPTTDIATRDGAASAEVDTLTSEQISRLVPTRRSVYIAHSGASVGNSMFVWHDDTKHVAKFFRPRDEDGLNNNILTSEGNEKRKSMAELLDGFCQRVYHPALVSEYVYMSIGIFLTALFGAYDGAKFRSGAFPWGVKGVLSVGREKRILQLHKKIGDQQVMMTSYGETMMLHRDESMMERDLVTYSIFGKGDDNDFAFMIIVDVKDEGFDQNFTHPAPAFEIAVAFACHDFHHAAAFLNDSTNNTEAAVLTRQIGRGVFDRLTRPFVPFGETQAASEVAEKQSSADDENATTEVAVTADSLESDIMDAATTTPLPTSPTSRSPSPPPKAAKKKRKSRKKKTAAATAADTEETAVEEVTVPTIIIQPPTPALGSSDMRTDSVQTSLAPLLSRHLAIAGPSAPALAVSEAVTPASTLSPVASPFLPRGRDPVQSSPGIFSFIHPHRLLVCAGVGCDKATHNMATPAGTENMTVICPRCTQYSATRFCCVEHLLDPTSLRAHFLSNDCGFNSMIRGAMDDSPSSILSSSLPTRPYIPEDMSTMTSAYPKNIIERHRQCVWRSMADRLPRSQQHDEDEDETGVDYHVFNDIDQMETLLGISDDQARLALPAAKKRWMQQIRGLGSVCARVRIDRLTPTQATEAHNAATTIATLTGNATPVSVLDFPSWATLKEYFDATLVRCLRFGYAAGTLRASDCAFVYEIVKCCLLRQGVWSEWMRERVAVQMGFEFGWRCPDDLPL